MPAFGRTPVVGGRTRRSGISSWRSAVVVLTTGAWLTACVPATSAPVPTASAVDPWSEHGPIALAAAGAPGAWDAVIKRWNSLHPNEPVTVLHLPTSPNRQHAAIAERAEADSGEYSVITLNVAWTAEFASKGWLVELPASRFPTAGMVPAAVASGTWQGALYAYPKATDAGLLFYRKDVLAPAGLDVPTSWAALETACASRPALSAGGCLGLPLTKDEGLTVSFLEALAATGGQPVTADGEPSVNTPVAVAAMDRLVDGLASGLISEDALAWSEQEAVGQFARGQLLFVRGWAADVVRLTEPGTPGADRTGVAQLPGSSGESKAILGGENLAISTFARNQGTAADFLSFVASEATQRSLVEEVSQGPVLTALYADADMVARHPYLAVLNAALASAIDRPVTTRYSEVSQAVQDQTTAALRGEKSPQQAMTELQARLESLLG